MLRSAVRRPLRAAFLRRPTASPRVLSSLLSSVSAAAKLPLLPSPEPLPLSAPHAQRAHTSESPNRRSVRARDYKEEQVRVLRAAFPHVLRLGWGEDALIAGARDAVVSSAIVGSFPRKDAVLVEATYLAEAVGSGVGSSVERLVKRVFQR